MNGTFVPTVGYLTTKNVYLYINGPMLLSAYNQMGDLFFISYADMTEDGEVWAVVRVSSEKLHSYESGQVDTRDMLLKAELGSVMLVNLEEDESRPSIRYLLCDDQELLKYVAKEGKKAPSADILHKESEKVNINVDSREIVRRTISELMSQLVGAVSQGRHEEVHYSFSGTTTFSPHSSYTAQENHDSRTVEYSPTNTGMNARWLRAQ